VQRLCIRIGNTPAEHSVASVQKFRELLVTAGRYASRAGAATDAQATIVWPAQRLPQQATGVTYGWQPDGNGKQQYFVQIDKGVLGTLQAGDEIHATLDPAAGRVENFVVKVGAGVLPRVAGAPAQPSAQAPAASPPPNRYSIGDAGGATPLANLYDRPPATSPATPPATAPVTSPAAGDYSRPSSRFNSSLPDRSPPANTYGPAPDPAVLEVPRPAYGDPSYRDSRPQPPSSAYPTTQDNRLADNHFTDTRLADARQFGQAPPAGAAFNQGAYEQPRGTLSPPADTLPGSAYAHSPAAEQPRLPLSPSQYAAAQDNRVASLPPAAPSPTAGSAVIPPVAAANPPLASEQWWWPYWLFLMFSLFLSIGGNLYLGWTAAEYYNRYRLAVDRLRSASRSA
jgi:hypothetical protein